MRRINQKFRMGRSRADKSLMCGRHITSRSHGGEVQALCVIEDVAHVVAHVVPTRIRCRTNPVHWRWTEIAHFTWIKDHKWIHEQSLISLGKVDPEIISIGLRGIIPHAEVAVIGIVDVYFASRMAAATGTRR